jgi:hypothetical protein
MICSNFYPSIEQCRANLPNTSQLEIMDSVYMDFLVSLKMHQEINIDTPPRSQPIQKKKKSPNIGATLGDSLTECVAKQLFALERMLRTGQCWIAYDKQMFCNSYMRAMARKSRATMAVKFWLSMELLIKVHFCLVAVYFPAYSNSQAH